MLKITKNERSWAISLISDINSILSKKTWQIKRAGGETTLNTGVKRMFPDIILYGDENQMNILQGWEIKMPDTSITDSDFIKDAERKANTLKLDSFFIWNFSYGVLYVRGDEGNFKIEKMWDETKYINTREDVETYKEEWLSLIEDILLDINSFFNNGIIHSAGLGEIISDTIMFTIINRNKSLVANELKNEAIANSVVRSYLDIWWNGVKLEYMSDENDKYEAYAKTILLNWVNKFIFAHMIKQHHNPAYLVESIDYSSSPKSAIVVFKKITEKCDFFNVFKDIEYNHYLPKETWNDLIEFNIFLSSNNIASIEHNALQTILENSVKSSKRTVVGQYTTPEKLAEILVKLTINDLNGLCLDPCCGTGTIPKTVLDYKNQYISIDDSYKTTWASDKYSFPLQISNISLTDSSAINIPCRIFQSNVFNLEVGQNLQIINPQNGEIMNISLPEFDTIVSNLPFVNFNREREEQEEYIQKIISEIENDTDIRGIGRIDLYGFIIITLKKLLKEGGKLGVITSNSWLGTEVGKKFFDVVRWYYNIDAVYISGVGKWFNNADVMATIIIMTKKQISAPSREIETTFGIINKTLEELEDDRLITILANSALQNKELNKDILQLKTYNQIQIDELLNKNISMNALFHDIDWLIDIEDNLCELGSLFKTYRGEKTGQDEIFYLQDTSVVESEYLIKGLKNTRNCNSLIAEPDTNVFYCHNTIDDLKELGHVKTLNWLSRFQNNLNKSLLIKGDKWHMLGTDKTTYLFTGMNPDKRIFFGKFKQPTFINQRLIGLVPHSEDIDIDLCHALLNSMIGMFYIEAIGFGRGLGALDFSKDNLEKILMLNPEILNERQKNEIMKAFQPLLERDILSTKEELLREDRNNFEHTVLQAFGIDRYFDKIKSSLLSMQSVRLNARGNR